MYTFYPELKKIHPATLEKDGGFLDILLLGGSVLRPEWGDVENELQRQLKQKYGSRFRIFNASAQGHTSRDSYFKYRQLQGKAFDFIIVYHGINEVRTNNCPPQVYQEDYSHYYNWYALLNLVDQHREMHYFTFPYTLRLGFVLAKEKMAPNAHISTNKLKPEWLKYGGNIKSAASFEKNMRQIIALANEKQEAVLLLTFAYHVPENYTLRQFQRRKLDYRRHKSAIEIWGKPKNVVKGIDEHNKMVENLANTYSEVGFIDMNRKMPKGKAWFDDICHLSPKGSEAFADFITDHIWEQVK